MAFEAVPDADDLHGLLDEITRRDAFLNFGAFCRYMWPVINPGTPLVWTPAHEAIAEHAQALVLGRKYLNRPLVVTCPPGIGKTYILSICLPAWAWLHRPEWRIFGVSHSIDLALVINVDRRDLIESARYQWLQPGFRLDDSKPTGKARKELDGGLATIEVGQDDPDAVERYQASFRKAASVHIEKGQRLKSYFRNAQKGWIRAISVNSKLTGKHCDLAVIDDPLDAAPVGMEKRADDWWAWYNGKFLSRFRSKRARRIVLVMQRLCSQDPAERLISQREDGKPGADHLNLPNEYMLAHPCPCRGGVAGLKDKARYPIQNCKTHLGWSDWRTVEGELLAPELLDSETTEKERANDLRTYITQYQQMVAGQSGGDFDPNWLQYWDEHNHAVDYVGTMDPTRGGTGRRSSWMVVQVWALLPTGVARCLDTLRIRGATEAHHRHALLLMMRRWPVCKVWKVERKVFGVGVLNHYQRTYEKQGIIIDPYNPDDKSKEVRAKAWNAHLQNGKIEVPSREAKRPVGIAPHYGRGNLNAVQNWRDELREALGYARQGDYEAALEALVRVDILPEDSQRAEAVADGRLAAEFNRQYEELRAVVCSGWSAAAKWPTHYREELRTFPHEGDDMIDATTIMADRWQHRIGKPAAPKVPLEWKIAPPRV